MDVRRISTVASLMLEADEANRGEFPMWSPEEALRHLALSKGSPVIVDLTRVRRAKSDLFGYLARIKALVGEEGGEMVLLLGDPALGRTIELLGLDRVFRVTWGQEEALRACGLSAVSVLGT